MANKGLSMRKVREVLRLHHVAGLSGRAIARSLKLSPTTVKRYIGRAEEAGLWWPLPESLDDTQLERRLLPGAVSMPGETRFPVPDWSQVHRELRRKGVTLALLWQEYKEAHPEGMQYSWFCKLYRAWTAKLDVVMRQEHTDAVPARRCSSTTLGRRFRWWTRLSGFPCVKGHSIESGRTRHGKTDTRRTTDQRLVAR